MKKFFQKNWFGLLSITISFIILASLIFSEGIGKFYSILVNLDIYFLLCAFAAIILYCILDGFILFLLAKIKYKSYNFFAALKTSVIGLFYSAITPLAIGGQPVQIVNMTRAKIKFGDAASFIIIKMIVYQVGLILYSLAPIFFRVHFDVPNFWGLAMAALFLNSIFILSIIFVCIKKDLVIKICQVYVNFFSKTKFFRLKNPDSTLKKIIEQINLFNESTKIIESKKFHLLLVSLLTFLQLSIYYSIAYFVLKSFGIACNIFNVIFITSLIYMITAFVPIPGASGANEGAFFIFFRSLLAQNSVIPIIFVWRFITYYFLIFVGGVIIIIDMLKRRTNL